MKTKYYIGIIILLFISSCGKKENNNLITHSWEIHYPYFSEQNQLAHSSDLFIRNDSVISYSAIEKEEKRFPVLIEDSLMIIKQLYSKYGKFGKPESDTIYTDTVLYDFKNLLGKPVLLLKPTNIDFIIVLSSPDNTEPIKPTKQFFELKHFSLKNLRIGERISEDKISDLHECSIDSRLICASLIESPSIQLQLINEQYIFRIKKNDIPESEIKKLENQITELTGKKPEKIMPHKTLQKLIWDTPQIHIKISKADSSWQLVYNHPVLQSVLEFYYLDM